MEDIIDTNSLDFASYYYFNNNGSHSKICIYVNLKSSPLQVKWPLIHSNMHHALDQFKLPLNCIKYTFKHYEHSNQHLQPPNMHLYTYNALNLQISKPRIPTDPPNMHQRPSQHEAPQKLLRALNPLKIHSLTNEPLGAKGPRWWEKKSARNTLAK